MEDKTGEHVALSATGNREDVRTEQAKTGLGKEYILPLTSALLLSYGYIYVRAYYGTFGIDVHSFFTIQDYLTENIDNIYILILPLIFTLSSIYIVSYSEEYKVVLEQQKREKYIRSLDYVIYALIIIMIADFIYETTKLGRVFYLGLLVISYIAWLLVAERIIPKLYPEVITLNRLYYMVLFMFLPISICNTFLIAKERAHSITENFIKTNTAVTIKDEVEKELKIKADALVLLGANSRYFFFYDPRDRSSHVIKAEAVSQVKVTEKPWQKPLDPPIPYP